VRELLYFISILVLANFMHQLVVVYMVIDEDYWVHGRFLSSTKKLPILLSKRGILIANDPQSERKGSTTSKGRDKKWNVEA
jgi:hypothetical protein